MNVEALGSYSACHAILRTRWSKRAVAALLACAAMSASAQYPNRPVRMLIPFTVGSAADIIARAMEPQLRERLGQALVHARLPGAP